MVFPVFESCVRMFSFWGFCAFVFSNSVVMVARFSSSSVICSEKPTDVSEISILVAIFREAVGRERHDVLRLYIFLCFHFGKCLLFHDCRDAMHCVSTLWQLRQLRHCIKSYYSHSSQNSDNHLSQLPLPAQPNFCFSDTKTWYT